MPEFKSFASIERLHQPITITEKIHGTNAQIFIEGGIVMAGSRSRWITPNDDNYGFATWVQERADVLRTLLGEGQHFGEWYGRGINAGYGLQERRFALFNVGRWKGLSESPQHKALGIDVVPVLYSGVYSSQVIDEIFDSLRRDGSALVPGYAKPEGIVVRWNRTGVLMKRTFESEDAAWTYKAERPPQPDQAEVQALCAPYWQPLRLEKLLSRDERFAADYPTSLPLLTSSYIADLAKETEIDESTLKVVKKQAFKAIKGMMAERGYTA